jgi:hypothetical protein
VIYITKALEIYFAISIPAIFVICGFFYACGKREEGDLVKPYESYTLMKETEMGWRDGR